jgi:hypothetical protein
MPCLLTHQNVSKGPLIKQISHLPVFQVRRIQGRGVCDSLKVAIKVKKEILSHYHGKRAGLAVPQLGAAWMLHVSLQEGTCAKMKIFTEHLIM